jgi:hypothetical protein
MASCWQMHPPPPPLPRALRGIWVGSWVELDGKGSSDPEHIASGV